VPPERIVDLHQDLLPYLEADGIPGAPGQTSWEALEAAGVRAVAATTFPLGSMDEKLSDPGMADRIERWLGRYHDAVAARPGWTIVGDEAVLTATALGEGEDPRGLLLTVEGLVVDERDPWERLERWHRQGWRVCCLMWNESSPLGGGTFDPDQGLTPLGGEVVDWLGDRGMVLDLSHASRATFRDAAERWDRPLVVSHANAFEVCPHPRNLERWQLDAVRESDGLVGVVLLDRFVSKDPREASAARVADHVLYLLEHVGPQHVGLGTDYGGLGTGVVPGLEGVDKLGVLFDELRRRGVDDDTLQLIAYYNSLRVLGGLLAPGAAEAQILVTVQLDPAAADAHEARVEALAEEIEQALMGVGDLAGWDLDLERHRAVLHGGGPEARRLTEAALPVLLRSEVPQAGSYVVVRDVNGTEERVEL
jgi:membrane dipeptidase